jgi:pyrophosphate--fructose-6-phosphate 1-phosphotransferase
MSSVRNLSRPADEWAAGGVPLTMMMNMERRYGEDRPVIRKALVELDGRPFARLKELRASCTVPTAFVYPGPIQYFGPSEVCDQPSITLQLEQGA